MLTKKEKKRRKENVAAGLTWQKCIHLKPVDAFGVHGCKLYSGICCIEDNNCSDMTGKE